MSEVRVLLVDDHPVVREGLRVLIDRQPGMRVVGEAADGATAAVKAGELQPHVVVMDISMPGVNGADATREIRKVSPHIRVVALTVHEDRTYVRELVEAGAAGYVLKRSAGEDLLRAIETVARGETYLDPGVAGLVLNELVRGQRKSGEAAELSNREIDVLRLIAQGFSNKEIGVRLRISTKTVETYKARAMEKLALTGRVDIVRLAVQEGWLRGELPDRHDDASGKS
jgi:DNA-binding NarL/FixJ family response regulator